MISNFSRRLWVIPLLFMLLVLSQGTLGKTPSKTKPKKSSGDSQSNLSTSSSTSKSKGTPKPTKVTEQVQDTGQDKTKKKNKAQPKTTPELGSSSKPTNASGEANSSKPKTFEPTDIMETDQREIGRQRYGIVGGYLNNDMRGTFTFGGKSQTADMKGKGFGLSGYLEHQFSGPFFGRAVAGIEQYQASVLQATAVCDGGRTNLCSVELLNLAMQAQAKIAVMVSKVPLWLAGGVGFWVPLAKTSTVFDSSSIGPMLTYVLSTGIDIPLFGQRFPFFVDYVVLSGGATVSGDSLILRLGYSWD